MDNISDILVKSNRDQVNELGKIRHYFEFIIMQDLF